MRILIVCSGNAPNFKLSQHQAFVYDQVAALKRRDQALQFDYFFITGRGLTGYLSCLKKLTRKLNSQPYQCIHAHVAMSGMLANLQRRVPVITTFHGSDINVPLLRVISLLVELLSRRTIYVSPGLVSKAIYTGPKRAIIPCGVDLNVFRPRNKMESRQKLGLLSHKKYVLFSSDFGNAVKNYPLARAATNLLADDTIELLELKNYTRQEVALLFTAVDVALMTSFSEGSPQFIKEALACNCPVVSTDVGDARLVMNGIPGCHLTTYDPTDVAQNIQSVLTATSPFLSRHYVQHLDNQLIADQIRTLYHQVE
ncbi:glycosyltransferase [Spirosoma rigui]|uniref:glycosyltransferase n=1 Tax=Spirosoma rigui TaxID=564064 RepID=UPI0009B069B6|nr:glycosyltransferase [Spirosoma rigui]